MSGWGLGWFGGGHAVKKDAPKKAILALRSQHDMLKKRGAKIEADIAVQVELTEKYVANNKKREAKLAIEARKKLETRLAQNTAQMATLDNEISSIETANINKETLDAMKAASAAMQQIHAGITADKVDDVMEGLREQHAIGEEINEAITSGGVTNPVDEDEIEDELEELFKEQKEKDQQNLEANMLSTGNLPGSLPTVPTRKLPQQKVEEEDDEEEELRKLQKEMAM